jgi:hypothetical protein
MYAVSAHSDVYHIAHSAGLCYVTSCGVRIAAPKVFDTPQNFPILHISGARPSHKKMCSRCKKLKTSRFVVKPSDV